MISPKAKKFITQILEPFAFGLLALLFIIPSITVVNLEPITNKLKQMDVLGITNKSEIQVNVIGGTHVIFSKEKLESIDGIYTYTTLLTRREADRYSKPILEMINNRSEEVNFEIYGNTSLPTNSNIALIINDQIYRLQSAQNSTTTHKITLVPGQKYVLFLSVENFSNIQFEEEFTLNIKEIQ